MQKQSSWQAVGADISKHERMAQFAKAIAVSREVGEGSAFGAAGQISVYVGDLRDLVGSEMSDKEMTAEDNDSEVKTDKGDGKEKAANTPNKQKRQGQQVGRQPQCLVGPRRKYHDRDPEPHRVALQDGARGPDRPHALPADVEGSNPC